MARRRRRSAHEALAVGFIVTAGACWIAAATVYPMIADEKHPHWWIVGALGAAGGLSLLLGLGLYFEMPFRKDKLAIEVAPRLSNIVSDLPTDHPKKMQEDGGAVLFTGSRFTSLEPDDVSLGVELVVDFHEEDGPFALAPYRHADDLPMPINLSPSSPGITGNLTFPWNPELMERMGNLESHEAFSLRIVDRLTGREAVVPLQDTVVTDEQ